MLLFRHKKLGKGYLCGKRCCNQIETSIFEKLTILYFFVLVGIVCLIIILLRIQVGFMHCSVNTSEISLKKKKTDVEG